jgi:hypothetical protein
LQRDGTGRSGTSPAAGAEGGPTPSLAFLGRSRGWEVVVRWDTYALVRLGTGQLHLAVTGAPPPDSR